MPALPPPPPSPEPPKSPTASPVPSTPAAAGPAATPSPDEPPVLMPYDSLLGSETAPPEPPPSLTFNVASTALPPPPPKDAPAKPVLPVPGIVVSDDAPVYVPALPAEPEPLLNSPVAPVPPPQPYAPLPPPPPARPRTIAELLNKVGQDKQDEEDLRAQPPEPKMWTATDAATSKTPIPVPAPPPARAPAVAARPPGLPPLPPQAPPPEPSFRAIAPAPVRIPPPSAAFHSGSRPMPLSAMASPRPMPLSPDDEHDFAAGMDDDDADTLVMSRDGSGHSASPEADTVIAVAAPMGRAHHAGPSVRLLAVLAIVLLALWMARLGSAPLFDEDEGAFAEATRELVVGHDWGSTTLNGIDRFDKPILVYWLQAVSLKTFGVTEFAARLPSALCAFFWCLALGQFAWRRFGPQVAIAAAGILATSLGPMLIGRAATADSLLNLLLTLSTLDLWRHLENGRDAPRRRAFAWIGLGLLAKGPVALLIPAAAAGLWLLFGRDRSRLVRLVGDGRAWALMIAISAPWYAYALWRHGMAFVNGFLLHHNIQRFTGSLEGHAGSLFYYVVVLPAAMLPWTPLLAPMAMNLRTRWKEPLGRFMLLWVGFVVVFFSLSGTKLPHYVLYGFTPLMLLAAQELAVVKRGVRAALFVTILACVIGGAASPWIAHYAAGRTHDVLYQTLLASAPGAPWAWLAVPIGMLVFASTIWVPNVRNYLSESDGAVAAGLLCAGWLVLAVLPWWAQTLQDPIRTLARTVPIAQLNLEDHEPVVQWHLHQPSMAYYLNQTTVRLDNRDPANGEWALSRIDRLKPEDLAKYEIVENVRGYVLLRPASAASEPLARLGAAQTAAAAASQAAYAAQLAATAEKVASEAALAASQAAANVRLQTTVAPTPPPAAPASVAIAPAQKPATHK